MANKTYFPNTWESAGSGPANDLYDATSIEVHHLLTDKIVRFKSFVTSFSDDHQAQWSEESVYGRMDSMATFQSTKRLITITFDVPSYSEEEAVSNLRNMNLIKQFLYPLYEDTGVKAGNALAISSSPLVRVKYANLITNNVDPGLGLLCLLKGITYNPVLDTGTHGSIGAAVYNLIAKQYSLSLNLGVLHEHRVGWTKKGQSYIFAGDSANQNKYPYVIDSAPSAERTEEKSERSENIVEIPLDPEEPGGRGYEPVVEPPGGPNGTTVGDDPAATVASFIGAAARDRALS